MSFLKVLECLENLKTRPFPKLLPRFCGPFKILKRVGSLAYKLELPFKFEAHPAFHVSYLQKHLLCTDNVLKYALVEFAKPLALPHKLEVIMDAHDLQS